MQLTAQLERQAKAHPPHQLASGCEGVEIVGTMHAVPPREGEMPSSNVAALTLRVEREADGTQPFALYGTGKRHFLFRGVLARNELLRGLCSQLAKRNHQQFNAATPKKHTAAAAAAAAVPASMGLHRLRLCWPWSPAKLAKIDTNRSCGGDSGVPRVKQWPTLTARPSWSLMQPALA